VDLEGHPFNVQIGSKSCSCGKFQEMDIACEHACSYLLYRNEDPSQHTGEEYSVQYYKNTYEQAIVPLIAEMLTESEMITPPAVKRGRGRPRKRRIRHASEAVAKRPKHCSSCSQAGHTRKTCKQPRA